MGVLYVGGTGLWRTGKRGRGVIFKMSHVAGKEHLTTNWLGVLTGPGPVTGSCFPHWLNKSVE